MKIGIDARFWQETGVGRYIRNLVFELEKINSPHTFVLFAKKDQVKEIEKAISKEKFRVVGTDIHWHSLKEQVLFSQVLQKEKLDLMHFPYFSVPIMYKGPFVVTIHDLINHHFPTGEASTLPAPFYRLKFTSYKYVIATAAKKAKKIIAVSYATRNEIVDHLHIPESKVIVTYEGVDPLVAKENHDSKDYGNYFLHVGNVYPHKNAKRLVDAFEFVTGDDNKLLFVGKKDFFMNKLEDYVKARNIDRVEFLGFVPDSELVGLYRHALATVVPSLMEGFGLPVLEAMANKSLVLASDIPSLREIGRDACLYVDPLNITSLSAKMQHIIKEDPKEFEPLKVKGVQIAKEFSWHTMAEATLQLYESCV
jgi:glycosyltransferase involved in cell wall biosynthesis